MALRSAPEKSIEREDAARYKYSMGAGRFILYHACAMRTDSERFIQRSWPEEI